MAGKNERTFEGKIIAHVESLALARKVTHYSMEENIGMISRAFKEKGPPQKTEKQKRSVNTAPKKDISNEINYPQEEKKEKRKKRP